MGLEKQEQQNVRLIQYELNIKCSVCNGDNKVLYVPHTDNDTFKCLKCRSINRIVITFITIPENPPGVRTMMLKPNERRIGEIKRDVGSCNISDRGACKSN